MSLKFQSAFGAQFHCRIEGMTGVKFALCITEILSTLGRGRLFCLLTKTKLKRISEDCCFEVSHFCIVLIISNEERVQITKQHNQVIIMNISTGRHFKVLIKISSAIDIVMSSGNIQASNHRPPKWTALHMQLIIEDVAQTTLGSLRFKASAQAFRYRRQLH